MYLENRLFYPIGTTSACTYAAAFLQAAGEAMVDHPTPEVTHVLLDVPSFSPGRGVDAEEILRMLPHSVTIIGGQLDQSFLDGYKKIDLLSDKAYLAGNAAITADCALQVAAPLLNCTLQQADALVIGWGRIGKEIGLSSMHWATGPLIRAGFRESCKIPDLSLTLPQRWY